MEKQRRDFLRTISTAAVLPAVTSILSVAAEPQSKRHPSHLSSGLSTDLRAQFPLLSEAVNGRPFVYLDSAATTQRPRSVLDAISEFYVSNRRSAQIYATAENDHKWQRYLWP